MYFFWHFMRLAILQVFITWTMSPVYAYLPDSASFISSVSPLLQVPVLGEVASDELSLAMERQLGEEIMRNLRQGATYLDDPIMLEYLNSFGASLIAANLEVRHRLMFDFFFFPVKAPSLNAFSLPGGFIGVHTGLLIAAQNESEFAAVLAHEIGHVSQRHIARMLAKQKQDSVITLASFLLGALVMAGSADLGTAAVMGGQAYAVQKQLRFLRNAEREADRIGLSILDRGGFETSGMVNFFGRLQQAGRHYSLTSDPIAPYLMTHPLTTERIADIQARIRTHRYRQRVDHLNFQMIRVRARVQQDSSEQGLREARVFFQEQLKQPAKGQKLAAHYGLALVALSLGQYEQSRHQWQQAGGISSFEQPSQLLMALDIDIYLAVNQPKEAFQRIQAARKQFPLSRNFAYQYAVALIADQQVQKAIIFLREQTQFYRNDAHLQTLLAKAYAAQGKKALQHIALANAAMLDGLILDALEQLKIARQASDAVFYDHAMIDALTRQWETRWKADKSKR